MEEYKRLTEKRETPLTMSMWGGTSKELRIYNRLCELEDKIENGTLIELPCKVGDVVYAPHWHFGKWDKIVSYQITNITITQNKKLEWTKKYRAMEVINGNTIDWQLNFAFDKIGEIVFLTKAEAEEKLKELKGEV